VISNVQFNSIETWLPRSGRRDATRIQRPYRIR